jgi:hypothetical protein
MTAADEFAQWLEKEHGDIYETLYAQARSCGVGFAGFGDDVASVDSAMQDVTIDTGSIQSTVDSSAFSTPSPADSPTGTSVGEGVLNALSSVGNWIVSPQGLTTLANVGTAVLKVQQSQAVAQTQMAVIQANAQRAAAGRAPIPITYATDASGHVVPVYDTTTAQMMPPQLETAISAGRARPVTLPDGTTGFAVDNTTLGHILGGNVPWWFWALAGGILLAAIV